MLYTCALASHTRPCEIDIVLALNILTCRFTSTNSHKLEPRHPGPPVSQSLLPLGPPPLLPTQREFSITLHTQSIMVITGQVLLLFRFPASQTVKTFLGVLASLRTELPLPPLPLPPLPPPLLPPLPLLLTLALLSMPQLLRTRP